ncbi:MAG: hypothetical protein UHK60_10995 [Acutalibacteraceae bacterium]|nr:hypothetical protein [Acutalibacteraceae bacterium]
MNMKQIVMGMLKNNSNPIFANLVNLAEQNNTKELENFARNYLKEQGRNYDEEFNKFINNFGLKK